MALGPEPLQPLQQSRFVWLDETEFRIEFSINVQSRQPTGSELTSSIRATAAVQELIPATTGVDSSVHHWRRLGIAVYFECGIPACALYSFGMSLWDALVHLDLRSATLTIFTRIHGIMESLQCWRYMAIYL